MLQQGEIVFIIVKKCFTINPNKFLYDISNMLERDNYGLFNSCNDKGLCGNP